jgi:3',5'-cyclic AMP phosphodiesterase CpdA
MVMDAMGMTRIVHLSDAHMLDPRPSRTRSGWSMRVRFLSFGRPLDAAGRQLKLGRSLRTARRIGADHVVLSGDLTEIGTPGEFETLAECLHDSGIPPERITLVPGNHDLYTSPDAWRWALQGPLAAFARTSAGEPGKMVDVGGATLMPIDATFHQPVTRSAGVIHPAILEAIERRASDRAFTHRPLVLVQHHPPFVRKTKAWHWIDGLIGARRLMGLLEKFRHLFVMHGHLHTVVDRALSCGVHRIFGVTAVVDDRDAPRVRVYDVRDGRVESAGLVVG